MQLYLDFLSDINKSEYLFETDLAVLSILNNVNLTVYTCKDLSILVPCLMEDDVTMSEPTGIIPQEQLLVSLKSNTKEDYPHVEIIYGLSHYERLVPMQ